VGFLDYSLPVGDTTLGLLVLGSLASFSKHRAFADQATVPIGNNAVRENLMHQLGAVDWGFATVVHPRAIVPPSAVLGAGSAVMAGAIVGTEARLGVSSIVNCGALVDHYATVEDYETMVS
jgi:UDP-3-O-[3-hydroxymyristoyl] glucosamine N-acyltransferase